MSDRSDESKRNDRELGMDRDITRRDFLNGVNIAVAASLLSTPLTQAIAALEDSAANFSAQMMPGYYPPIREGLRGSHPGSFEVAHSMRDGTRWDDPNDSTDTGEEYDLVVVGGGISGLAAAYFFQKEAGANAKILIVENHDDFGGHAKRNEFHYQGHMLVDLGGAEYIETPWSYPDAAAALLKDLGVDVNLAKKVFDHDLYDSLGLRGGIFFDKKTFGDNQLVAGAADVAPYDDEPAYVTLPAELANGIGDKDAVSAYLDKTPLSSQAREQILHLFCGDRDYLAGKSTEEKAAVLKSISYLDFLTDYVDADPEVINLLSMWRASYWGNGIDLWPAFSALSYGLPGTAGLGLVDEIKRSPEWDTHNYKEDFHFPDGNASVARLLVRRLIPGAAPGNSMHDIVAAKFDYAMLDEPGSPVRLRLNATAVHVGHVGDPNTAKRVEVTYVQGGEAKRVKARNCILACYLSVIPHLCPELGKSQKEALGRTIRMPLVSVNVLIDNWKAFEKLKVFSAYCPGSYFCDVRLTYPLHFADYQSARSPDEPMTVHMYRIPLPGELPAVEQLRAGRHDLLGTSFEHFEREIRAQLGAMLELGGFDPARDIKAITVNRWPHGYATGWDTENVEFSEFSDPLPDEQQHWFEGRQQFGRIAIANSDAAASAMTESAIEQGYRATQEILGGS
ncbi:MAG: FAD-dependent oxidoreductase [Gammaproteobacteria bacterium]|nr:FAD-dependent oxidoreductase [Gammaproteobacteria bacterium]